MKTVIFVVIKSKYWLWLELQLERLKICTLAIVCSFFIIIIIITRLATFVWLMFNGTSTQEGHFVPTAGGWNRLGQLRMTNETQCTILQTLHNYNVTQFTLKHSSYITATISYLIVWLTCLNITLVPSTIPNHITQVISHSPYSVWSQFHAVWMQY